MTAALLAAALAIVAWPGPAAVRRRRLGALGGRRPAGRHRPAAVPVPLLAGLAAVGVGAVAGTPLVAALAGVAALTGARVWAAGRRDRAGRARLLAVAEGVGAMAAELRSGRSLDAATGAAVAACGDGETGAALARAVRSGIAGPAVPDPALPGFAGPRSPVGGAVAREAGVTDALDQVASGVRLSGRTGCSLAAVLTAVEDDVRARHRLQLELRSVTAGPRSSAWLLAGLPLLGLAMGNAVGADPWQVLTTTGTGRLLLVAGVGLELAGLAWSRRLVDRALR